MAKPVEAPVEANEKVNPFDKGVTYVDFLKALGENEIQDYLKDICTEDQIVWLVEDLKHFNK